MVAPATSPSSTGASAATSGLPYGLASWVTMMITGATRKLAIPAR